jgi:hypothetical protein
VSEAVKEINLLNSGDIAVGNYFCGLDMDKVKASFYKYGVPIIIGGAAVGLFFAGYGIYSLITGTILLGKVIMSSVIDGVNSAGEAVVTVTPVIGQLLVQGADVVSSTAEHGVELVSRAINDPLVGAMVEGAKQEVMSIAHDLMLAGSNLL